MKFIQQYFAGIIELMKRLLNPKKEQPQLVLIPVKKIS